ncbi:hypothetical protein EEL32_07895 [Brevibacillus laterosporus]|nr:hypothetical protein [Brevibacillus laterosporus]TPG68134.1 hypothetical protein EEL31_05985 [Brevibacillus laterosporus]TPG88852.1 hypothetical protein EEL32_07895 [Brevibacillus laterosporus]
MWEDKITFDRSQTKTAYIPSSYLQNLIGIKLVHSLSIKAKSKKMKQAAMDQTIRYLSRKTLISWDCIFIAFGFSSAIGIFFGLYPANKTAKLDPIDALDMNSKIVVLNIIN